MRRVIVWRHGETEHNRGGIYQGQLDVELSSRGVDQAAAAAEALAAMGPARLITSDLSRARRTADALAQATDLSREVDPRLREIHVGEWAGLTHAEVVSSFAELAAAVDRGEDVRRGGTGERVADVRARVRACFDEVVSDLDDASTAVLTTHGVASRALVADVVGLTYEQSWHALVGLHNCHWAELVQHRTGWRLEAWNRGVLSSVGSVTDR